MKIQNLFGYAIFFPMLVLSSCGGSASSESETGVVVTADYSADSSRIIAEEAWIYAYPMHRNFKIVYGCISPNKHSETGAVGFNRYRHFRERIAPRDTFGITSDDNVRYSRAVLDVSAEPAVLDIPAMTPVDRYFCWQLSDLYGYNFAYIGTRTTGNNSGKYLIAKSGWNGVKPEGISGVISSETDFVIVLGSIQLLGADDTGRVAALQNMFRIVPLHTYMGTKAPEPVVRRLPFPGRDEKEFYTPAFIGFLNNYLQYTTVDPSEKVLRERFARIGIVPGNVFDPSSYQPDVLAGIEQGVKDAERELKAATGQTRSTFDLFGTRADLKNDYLKRAVGAAECILGNTAEESIDIRVYADADGKPLTGGSSYIIRFKKDELPPCKYFWSIIVSDAATSLSPDGSGNRRSIGDGMQGLKYEKNGDRVIYLQPRSPGKDKESNWLPAPSQGAYDLVCRIYGPGLSILNGTWKFPAPEKAEK